MSFQRVLKALRIENDIQLYFLICLLSTIPSFATNAIVSSLSLVPWLSLGENFGWSGINLTDTLYNSKPLAAFKYVLTAAFFLSLATFVIVFRSKKLAESWLYALAIAPSGLLAFWCAGTIGSVMLYDFQLVVGEVYKYQPGWFDQLYPLSNLSEAVDAKTLVGKAKIEFANRLYHDRINNLYNLPYYVFCDVLLIFYVAKFGFRNSGLAIFLGLTFLTTLIINYSWSWSFTAWVLVALYPAVSAALLCAIVRFFVRAYRDNGEIFRHRRAAKAAGLALIYWTPFAVVFISMILGGYLINKQIEEWTYDPLIELRNNPELAFPDIAATKAQIIKPIMRDQRLIRDDLGIFLVDQIGKLKKEIENVNEQQSPDALRNAIIRTFDNTIHPSLEGYSPSFRIDGRCVRISFKRIRFNVPCLVRDLKNSVLNSMYQFPKNAVRNFVLKTTDATITKLKQIQGSQPVQIAGALKKDIIASLDKWAVNTRQGLDLGWFILALASLAGFLLLLQSICRALITIFGRLLVLPNLTDLDRDGDYFTMAPVENQNSTKIVSRLAEQGEMLIDIKQGEKFYVKHSLDVSNANRVFSPPLQPFSNPIARIFSRRYFLRRIERNNTLPLKITDIGSSRFVSVRLAAGDRLAFRWKNFVGMTDNAKLEYLFGVRMPMVVSGHVRVPTIRGPGLLILKVDGAATIAKDSVNSDSVAPYRLVAWDVTAEFRIVSSQEFFSVYMDDCQIDLLQDDRAIIDIARDGQALPGLFRQLWKTIRP